MDFELELWDESIIDFHSKSEINDLIDELNGKENKRVGRGKNYFRRYSKRRK